MTELEQLSEQIRSLVDQWESKLLAIDEGILQGTKNKQHRTIKMILGHLIDSASNNLHRTVHLQYQSSPLQFPDYANLGANDKWIGIQQYQAEDWFTLVRLWEHSNRHLAHVIGCISASSLENLWISALGEKISLRAMVVDYPRHLKLHLSEIDELLASA